MPETKKVNVNGFEIAFSVEGEGEPLLLIHGITTYSFIWRKIIPGLTAHFKVYALDLLGCGESDKPLQESLSLKNQAVMISGFLEKLNIAKVHLVTHDVGGGVGQLLAVNYPDKIVDLTLINTVAYDFWPVQPIVTMRTPIIRQLAMSTLDFGVFRLILKRGLYKDENLTPELMDLFWKPLKTSLGRKAFLHFAKCLNNEELMEIGDDLRNLKIPVLILRGENDVYLSKEISIKLNENIPESRLVSIDKAGHFIMEDVPEKISREILIFLGKV